MMKSKVFPGPLLVLGFLLFGLFLGGPAFAMLEGGMLERDDTTTIEYFVFGEGPETILIASGLGRPAADLEDLAHRIAGSGVRTVIYNYRTIGASDAPTEGLTLHDYADDVWRIVDALGLEQVHLAGKTYGNRVMRMASADHPERVKSIILIGAGGQILPSQETQDIYRRIINPDTSSEERARLRAEVNFAPGNQHLAALSADFGDYPELSRAQMAASDASSSAEWVGGGTAPMLILTGLQDRVAVPENALAIAKDRAGTWVVGIPNCGHNMVFEQPEELRRLIVEFVMRQSMAETEGQPEVQ